MDVLADAPQPWPDETALLGPDAPPPTGHIDWLIAYLLTVRKRFGNTAVRFDRLRWGSYACSVNGEQEMPAAKPAQESGDG